MKAFLVVCLAAAAVADPNLVLPYGVGVPAYAPYYAPHVAAYAHHPAVVPTMLQKLVEPFQVQQAATKKVAEEPMAMGPKVDTYAKKPEEAMTYKKAVPAVPYAGLPFGAAPYVAAPVAAAPAKVKTFADDSVKPENYAAKNQYVAETEGSLHIAKREAEAEADPALVYSVPHAYGAYPAVAPKPLVYGQHLAYSKPVVTYAQHLAYNNPVVYGQPLAYPTVYNNLKVKSFADDSVKPEKYAAKNEYVAETEGSLHIAKREAEAEAEADPALVYSLYNKAYAAAPAVVRSAPAFTTPYLRTAPYTTTPYAYTAGVSPYYYNTLGYYNF